MQERGRRPKARASPARVEETRCGHNRACSARPHTPARALLGPAWRAPGRTALPPHRYRPAQPPAPAGTGTGTRGRSSRSGPGEPRPRPARGLRMRLARLGRARCPGKGSRAGGRARFRGNAGRLCPRRSAPSPRACALAPGTFGPKRSLFFPPDRGEGTPGSLGDPWAVRGERQRAVRRRLPTAPSQLKNQPGPRASPPWASTGHWGWALQHLRARKGLSVCLLWDFSPLS